MIEYMDSGDLQGFLCGCTLLRALIASISFECYVHFDSASRNQAHRDIKPASTLLTQKGDVKVSDYGIAKKIEGGDEEFKTFTERRFTCHPSVWTDFTTPRTLTYGLWVSLMSLHGTCSVLGQSQSVFLQSTQRGRDEIVAST